MYIIFINTVIVNYLIIIVLNVHQTSWSLLSSSSLKSCDFYYYIYLVLLVVVVNQEIWNRDQGRVSLRYILLTCNQVLHHHGHYHYYHHHHHHHHTIFILFPFDAFIAWVNYQQRNKLRLIYLSMYHIKSHIISLIFAQ